MNFDKVNGRFDSLNRLWIDIKVNDIHVLHKAALLGGRFMIYELYGNYYINFCHNADKYYKSFVNFYGLEITKEQYDFQYQSWGNFLFEIEPGTQIALLDNLYFV